MRSPIATVIIALASALALAGVAAQSALPSAPLPDSPLSPLPDKPGQRMPGADCLIEPRVVVTVGSSIDGVIENVLVDRGDTVKAGQVVARLMSGVEAASVDVRKTKAEFGARKSERNEGLARQQLISIQEKDELDTERRMNEAELRRDVEALNQRTILSPIDGVVVERYLSKGELLRQDKARILKLAQLDPLHVEIVMPYTAYGSIRIGMVGLVTVSAPGRGTHKATVTVVDRTIDAASGTFGVRLELPNPELRIPSGLKCQVRFAR